MINKECHIIAHVYRLILGVDHLLSQEEHSVEMLKTEVVTIGDEQVKLIPAPPTYQERTIFYVSGYRECS